MMKKQFTRPHLEALGFQGFQSVRDLRLARCVPLPMDGGVYLVLRTSETPPTFSTTGTGGWFKGKDPNVSLVELRAKWLPDVPLLYVGKATGLRERVDQLLRFGAGSRVGHWGGRYLWQVKGSEDFLVTWKRSKTPRATEASLILEFVNLHSKLPFANLIG